MPTPPAHPTCPPHLPTPPAHPTCPPHRSAKEANGAYAIVLSGGYVDDEDNGMSFWYTGEGGQEKGKQVCVGGGGERCG